MSTNYPSLRDGQIAASVRAELGRQRRTQRELAAALAVHEQKVSKRVRGVVPFTADEIVQVARFLGTTVEQLVGDAPSPRPAVPAPRHEEGLPVA